MTSASGQDDMQPNQAQTEIIEADSSSVFTWHWQFQFFDAYTSPGTDPFTSEPVKNNNKTAVVFKSFTVCTLLSVLMFQLASFSLWFVRGSPLSKPTTLFVAKASTDCFNAAFQHYDFNFHFNFFLHLCVDCRLNDFSCHFSFFISSTSRTHFIIILWNQAPLKPSHNPEERSRGPAEIWGRLTLAYDCRQLGGGGSSIKRTNVSLKCWVRMEASHCHRLRHSLHVTITATSLSS